MTSHHDTVKVERADRRKCPILHKIGKSRPRDSTDAPTEGPSQDESLEPEFFVSKRELESVVGQLQTSLTEVRDEQPADIDEDLSSFLSSTSSGRLGEKSAKKKAMPTGKRSQRQERIVGVLDEGRVVLVTGNVLLHWTDAIAAEAESAAGASAITPTSLMHTINTKLGSRSSPLPSFYKSVWEALYHVHHSVLGSVDDFLSDPTTRSSSRTLVVAVRGCDAASSKFLVIGICVCSELPMAVRCFSPSTDLGEEGSALSSLLAGSSDDVWADEAVVLGDTRCTGCICGVHLVWVCKQSQGCGIASALIDACRRVLLFHHVIPRSQVAFSQPTRQGKLLALRYTRRRDFLTFI
jgi:hypothetical protein